MIKTWATTPTAWLDCYYEIDRKRGNQPAWLTTLVLAGSALATLLSGAAVEAHGPVGAAVAGTAIAAADALVCLALGPADA